MYICFREEARQLLQAVQICKVRDTEGIGTRFLWIPCVLCRASGDKPSLIILTRGLRVLAIRRRQHQCQCIFINNYAYINTLHFKVWSYPYQEFAFTILISLAAGLSDYLLACQSVCLSVTSVHARAFLCSLLSPPLSLLSLPISYVSVSLCLSPVLHPNIYVEKNPSNSHINIPKDLSWDVSYRETISPICTLHGACVTPVCRSDCCTAPDVLEARDGYRHTPLPRRCAWHVSSSGWVNSLKASHLLSTIYNLVVVLIHV